MSQEEKWALEREAAELFVESQNQSDGTNLVLEKHSDKPDFIARDDFGRTVGIEITHLFYDDDEARLLLGRTMSPHLPEEDAREIIEVLNRRLAQKEEKARKYKFDHSMILVIRVASPVFDKATFDEFQTLIKVPQSVFDQIWLLFNDESGVAEDNLKQLK